MAYWSDRNNGTLTVRDIANNDSRQLTDIPRLGLVLVHEKLDVVIAFGHFDGPPPNRRERPGLLANISMYDFSDSKGLRKLPSSEHERIFKAYHRSWLPEGILLEPRLGTAAAFHMLVEGQPFFLGDSNLQVVIYDTVVYLGDMEYHGATKLGVEDLGIEGHPRRAELLDFCYRPETVMLRGELDAAERVILCPRLFGDGKYLVQCGFTMIQVWCFDEDSNLNEENTLYWQYRTSAARVRAIRRREATRRKFPSQSLKKVHLENRFLEYMPRLSCRHWAPPVPSECANEYSYERSNAVKKITRTLAERYTLKMNLLIGNMIRRKPLW